MAFLPEIPCHSLHFSPQGFQLFQCFCQSIPAGHIQRTSGVEVVGQIVKLISYLTVLFDEPRKLRRYHGDLLPTDWTPLFEQLSKKLVGDISHMIAPF